MKKVLVFYFLICSLFAEGQITFEKTYGDTGIDKALNIIQTTDSGFLITTMKGSYDQLYIIKTNPWGDTLWTKGYSLNVNFTQPFKGIQTSDGGYAFSGGSGAGAFLFKTTTLGDSLWLHFYHPTFYGPSSFSFIETYDHDFIMVGRVDTISSSTICCSAILMRTDSIGNLNWYSIWADGAAWDIIQDRDSNILVSWGFIYNGPPNQHVTKYNKNLTPIWDKTYSLNGASITLNLNSGEGYILSVDIISAEDRLLKTDSAGNIEWNKHLINYNQGNLACANQTLDNGYVLVGATYSGNDLIILKTDSVGDSLWTSYYGGTGIDYGTSIIVCKDSGFAAVGTTSSFGAINNDIYFIKTNNSGLITSVKNYSFDSSSEISISPNPFHTTATLKVNEEFQKGKLRIYNTLGAIVCNQSINNQQSMIINRNSLPDGLYFYELRTNNYELMGSGKFVVE